MRFRLLCWNIGGAKYLETKTAARRDEIRHRLNEALKRLVKTYDPDVVTLQEVVQWREPPHKRAQDLVDPPRGYTYHPFVLIDSDLLSSKAKWNKVREGSDWHSDTYFAQGNAFLFRQNAPRFPVWALPALGETSPAMERRHCVEQVTLASGLYFGDRNTEPRAALVTHLVYDPSGKARASEHGVRRKPLDIFVVNLHLTTVMMEREGIPEIDHTASRIRLGQLETVMNGIVSRYNLWWNQRYPERGRARNPESSEDFDRYPPVWILAGDFNFTPESEEYAFITRRNFIDVIHQKGTGSKASGVGNPATLTLDYVFAGPRFIALDPLIVEKDTKNNAIDHTVAESDHYPMFASIPLELA